MIFDGGAETAMQNHLQNGGLYVRDPVRLCFALGPSGTVDNDAVLLFVEDKESNKMIEFANGECPNRNNRELIHIA